jgi:hypothetical protein
LSLLGNLTENQDDETEDTTDDDFYYSGHTNDPFEDVDWGDPSTFNEAAWGQFNDRD